VVINATDLGSRMRFPFYRPYFDIICADIDPYPVSRAVAASSAVPGLLSPISLESHAGGCGYQTSEWITQSALDEDSTARRSEAKMMLSFLDREKRPWLHLVDGGIADNLGLRSYYNRTSLAGGLEAAFPAAEHPGGRQVLMILVNAIVKDTPEWALVSQSPSLVEVIASVSSIQLARYDLDTIELVRESFERWTKESARPGRPVSFDFVEVSFEQVRDDAQRKKLEDVGTNFDLSDEQVDLLITAAREILRESTVGSGSAPDRSRARHGSRGALRRLNGLVTRPTAMPQAAAMTQSVPQTSQNASGSWSPGMPATLMPSSPVRKLRGRNTVATQVKR
jgi:NTE family protein